MTAQEPVPKKAISADWLVRGVLTKVGDTFDRFTGRRWVPSSSLATSELIEQLKKLLDAEARDVPGKGMVVPHDIRLKMQWNKFSDDSEKGIAALRTELMTAAVDHINNSLYYTFAPLSVEVNADYFTEGVKLTVGFGSFDDEEEGVELDVRLPSSVASSETEPVKQSTAPGIESVIVHYSLEGRKFQKAIPVPENGRISVGRTSESAFAIEHTSISKLHATIVVQSDGTLALADTGSTNGTFVNGERMSYGKALPLTSADNVRFGSVDVTLEAVPKTVEAALIESAEPKADTVEIDGFEFTSRTAEETVELPASQPRAAEETVEFLAPQPRVAEEKVEFPAPQPPIAEKTIIISPIATDKPEDSPGKPIEMPEETPDGEGQ